jgi:Kef-type K+ transport system membrane component KefB
MIFALTAILFLVIKPLLLLLVKKTSKSYTASQLNIFVIFMLLFACSFFSEMIGVDAFFGAFIVGLITPHEDRFAIDVTEKVNLHFLP